MMLQDQSRRFGVYGVVTLVAAALLAGTPAWASPTHSEGMPRVQSRAGFDFSLWETVPIQHGGVEKSLYTFARETVGEVTGSVNFEGRGPMENMFSMAFEPEVWGNEPILKIRRPELKKLFDGKRRVSFADLEAARPQWMPMVEGEKRSEEVHTEIGKLFAKGNMLIAPAHKFNIVPVQDFRGQKDEWITIDQFEETGARTPTGEKLVAAWSQVRQAFLAGDAGTFNTASRTVIASIGDLGVPTFSPGWKFGLDRWMSKVRLFALAGWIYFAASLIFLVSYLAGRKLFTILGGSILAIGTLTHVAALIVWGLLAGRTPVSNLFEASVFIIGAMTAISVVISAYYKTRIVGLAGSTLGAFFMGIANITPLEYGRQMKPLVDALQSYWLHIHVTSMLISYAFFAISFFVSASWLLRRWMLIRKPGTDIAADQTLGYLDSLNFRIITIGFPVLTGGVILGAVWASEAWGRPWAFDPKETAAAITWMIYALYLHCRLFLGWKGQKGMWLSILGAAAVLFTYLGVSFFLPGLHSYVSSEGVSFWGFMKRLIPGI